MKLIKYFFLLWITYCFALPRNRKPNECYVIGDDATHRNRLICFATQKSILYNNSSSNITEMFIYRSEMAQVNASLFENYYHQLYTLALLHGNLSSVDDTSFNTLLELHQINLSFNKIRNISEDAFVNNNKLRIISLMSNKIYELKPDTFSTLVDLETIDLTRNHLTKLDKYLFIDNENLTKLDVKFNSLSEISSVMFHSLSKLTSLDLSFNKIETIPAHTFKYNYELKKINLQGNRITILDFDLTHLGLEQLNIRGNPLNASDNRNREVIEQLRESQVQIKVSEQFAKHDHRKKDNSNKEITADDPAVFRFSPSIQFVFGMILLLLLGIFIVLSLLLYNVYRRKHQKLFKRYYPDNRRSREYLHDERENYLELSVSDGSAIYHNKDEDDRTEDHEESCSCPKCLQRGTNNTNR